MRWIVHSLCFLAFAVVARPARAEMFPVSGPRTLAEQADLVVEARWEGGDSIRILRTRVASRRLPEGATDLSVVGLRAMDRVAPEPGVPFGVRGSGGTPIASKELLLFADFDGKAGAWRAIDTLVGGAQGVWWIHGTRVLRYEQSMSPDAYALTDWKLADGRLGTRADLDAAIATGIEGRSVLGRAATQWFQRDGLTRVLEYAALPCPDRIDATHVASVAAHHLRHAESGGGSAWRVVDAIEAAADTGARSRLVAVLTHLGEGAKPVAHRLVPLLAPSARGSRAEILRALSVLQWPGARDAVRAVLAEGTAEEAFPAVRALEAIRDAEVGPLLAKRLAAEPAAGSTAADLTWLASVLRHQLARIDPVAAVAVAKRWKDDAQFAAGDREEFAQLATR